MKLTFLVFSNLQRMRTLPFTFKRYLFVKLILDEISVILLPMFSPRIVVPASPRVPLATNLKL